MIKKMYYQCPVELGIILGSGARLTVDGIVLRLILKSNLGKLGKILSVGLFALDTVTGFNNISGAISLMKSLE